MNLPFTVEQFLAVFRQYNESVWPSQILLNLVGLGAIVLPFTRWRLRDAVIAGALGFLWIWTGVAYHLAFFAAINPAAYLFSALTIVQGILFLVFGVFRTQLKFSVRTDIFGVTGALLVVYALVVYPILGSMLGHGFPESPTFGLPCPTTIFTFGLMLWAAVKVPKAVVVIPFLW